MGRKWYFLISGTIFSFLSIAHLARLVAGWEIAFAGNIIPQWVSFPALAALGFLAAWGFSLAAGAGGRDGRADRTREK